MAKAEADPVRKAELERIADTMGWVMENPARDFRDAIQALWFYQMCVYLNANLHGCSIGRVDQYLGSYLEADLASGAITRAEAAVLLGNMIGASTPTVAPVFSDADAIPAWAAPSLSSLTAMGIMDAENGHAEPLSAVTRAEAAEMLYELARSVE